MADFALRRFGVLPVLLLSLPITPLTAQTARVGCKTTAAPQEQAPATPSLTPPIVGMNRPVMPKAPPSSGPWPRNDYPAGPLRDGIEGTVGFTLSVGADGRPIDCAVTSSSGNAELDAATCVNLMKQARFNPKVVDGNPVPSTYSNRVRWELPKEHKAEMAAANPQSAPQPIRAGQHRAVKPRGDPALWVPQSDYPLMEHPAEGTTGFTLYVGADGRATSCKITSSSGSAELDTATCKGLMRRARFDPRLDNGKPVPSTYSNRVIWVIPE